MVNGAQLLEALASLETEKGINKQIALEGIVEGFQKAYERFFDTDAIIKVEIDDQTGAIKLLQELLVVENDEAIDDDWLEIDLQAAKKIVKDIEVGQMVYKNIEFDEEFSRVAVGQVRQIFQQKIRATEREMVYNKFISQEGEIISGKILGMNDQQTSYLLDIEGVQTSLWNQKCINHEQFEIDQFVDVLLEEVSRDNKFSQLAVSRIAPRFLSKLIEREVNEVNEGIVEVVSVSREPGKRAKIAVMSHETNVEPIGAIVGVKGARINRITAQLQGEKIDVVRWSEDFFEFIINAMAPVKVISVNEVDEEYDIVVPNQQLSLAIGKGGMAAKLVANLLKRRINIYSLENAIAEKIDVLWNGNITESEVNDPNFINEVNRRKQKTQTVRQPFTERPKKWVIDEDALSSFQAQVEEEYSNEFDEIDAETLAAIESADQVVGLADIEAELKSFDKIIADEIAPDDEYDEETDDEYDEYYQ